MKTAKSFSPLPHMLRLNALQPLFSSPCHILHTPIEHCVCRSFIITSLFLHLQRISRDVQWYSGHLVTVVGWPYIPHIHPWQTIPRSRDTQDCTGMSTHHAQPPLSEYPGIQRYSDHPRIVPGWAYTPLSEYPGIQRYSDHPGIVPGWAYTTHNPPCQSVPGSRWTLKGKCSNCNSNLTYPIPWPEAE